MVDRYEAYDGEVAPDGYFVLYEDYAKLETILQRIVVSSYEIELANYERCTNSDCSVCEDKILTSTNKFKSALQEARKILSMRTNNDENIPPEG